jgi:hypothetical protein
MSDRSTHHGHRHVCSAWWDRKNCAAECVLACEQPLLVGQVTR